MLQELSDESRQMGLTMNIAKTQVMVIYNTSFNVYSVLIEKVEGCVYMTQHNYTLSRKRTRTKRFNEESWQVGQRDGDHTI